MSKFQVGDRVVRTAGFHWRDVHLGAEYIIKSISDSGVWCSLQGIKRCDSNVHPFELVNFELAPEQPKEVPTLTPKEVLQAVIDGRALQVQHIVSKTWIDVALDSVSINWAVGRKVRYKPSTVEVHGTEVIQPKLDNAVLWGQKYFTLSEGLDRVVMVNPTFKADLKLYWDSYEDACVALNATRAVLQGE